MVNQINAPEVKNYWLPNWWWLLIISMLWTTWVMLWASIDALCECLWFGENTREPRLSSSSHSGLYLQRAQNSQDIQVALPLRFGPTRGHKCLCASKLTEQRQGCFVLAVPDGRLSLVTLGAFILAGRFSFQELELRCLPWDGLSPLCFHCYCQVSQPLPTALLYPWFLFLNMGKHGGYLR